MTTITKSRVTAPSAGKQPIRAQLRKRLLALNFHAFAHGLGQLLSSLGYEDVRMAGRTHWKGRSQNGGFDLQASLPAGVAKRPVIVSVKQFDTLPIYQRSIDELRGACLRVGASEALLITLSTFSPTVLQNAAATNAAGSPLVPVRLLDGDDVLDLMLLHRIGVQEQAGATPQAPRHVRLDEAFFDGLARRYSGNSREGAGSVPPDRSLESWFLTIEMGLAGMNRRQQAEPRQLEL